MLDRFSHLVLAFYREALELPPDQFQDWALDQLRTLIPFDSALWLMGVLHSDQTATIHSHHCHKISPQVFSDWARCGDRAVLTEKVFNFPGTTFNCVAECEFGPELLAHSRRYGIEHLLATTVVDPISRLSELISIYRADRQHPFTEAERFVQQNLVPHLAETWRINRMKATACHPDGRSAVSDRQGVLHLVDPEFARMMRDEWPDWKGPKLPDEMTESLLGPSGRFAGKHLVVSASASGDSLLLRGRQKGLLDSLSDREIEVANRYAAGNTYKEIAKALGLAPSTVRNHIGAIYVKLGICNKAGLVSLLQSHT